MKRIFFSLIILLLVSCKKEVIVVKAVNKTKDTLSIKDIKFVSFGDKIISQDNFISQIKNSTDIAYIRKNLSKIKFDYDQFNEWDFNTIEKKNIGDISLQLKREKADNSDATICTHISLSIYKNNKKADKIIIYKNENYSEALVVITRFFYINSDFDLWLLDINEDEEGINFNSWNQYRIDKNSGKINLIKSIKNNEIYNEESNI
ncbi:hypothetical protein L1276_000610 [Flavobacterium sp. HSC-32F16]|uniref:hypothetical protein n=1 Tax=Flavobacterium sp. HSC-32F16 TaxID=2910964 RepID=UPI0020A5BFAE|nr:hypothetical protein [Flavobacterium sp. HSC-32F16]MCP2025470.1 hypothetical protein [Flavobacterium sp. HSC-32F16]